MRTLPYALGILEYLPTLVQASVSLKAHPVTEALAADLVPLKDEWKAVLLKQIQLQEKVAEADARVLLADFDLDALFVAIVNALMTVANNDRQNPIIARFLGDDRPSSIREPILGEQLERMRAWPPGLATVGSDEVKKLGTALAALVTKADAVVETQRKAAQELTDFNEIGDLKTFVDHLNAASKRLYGKLSELMHSTEGASLPRDFPDRCFPPESRARRPTIKGEERTIERLQRQLARHQGILAELKKQEAEGKAARDAAEKAARQNEADALKKQAQEILARAAEIEANIKDKPEK